MAAEKLSEMFLLESAEKNVRKSLYLTFGIFYNAGPLRSIKRSRLEWG
jgi:hypothetical protein